MKATIWARPLILPSGICYNCNAPSTTSISVRSEGGIASSVGAGHGLLVAAVAAAATVAASGSPHQITYCGRCAVTAHKKAPERLPPTLGLLAVVIGFAVIAFLTTGGDRIVASIVAVAALGGVVAWLRYIRRPPQPGQTTRWRAFAVLNEGKDLLHLNSEFVRIEYSNPRVLAEIIHLNPGVDMTPR